MLQNVIEVWYWILDSAPTIIIKTVPNSISLAVTRLILSHSLPCSHKRQKCNHHCSIKFYTHTHLENLRYLKFGLFGPIVHLIR